MTFNIDPEWQDKLKRSRSVELLERISDRIRAFSAGDRFIFFALAGLLGFAVGTVSRVSPQILTRARQQEMPSVDQRTDKS